MAGSFFDTFNPTLEDLESSFTEDWSFNNQTYPAIAIETLDEDHHIIKGGTLLAANVRIHVREDIFQQSGVQIGSFVSARDTDLFVSHLESDGDAARVLVCTSKGIDLWR